MLNGLEKKRIKIINMSKKESVAETTKNAQQQEALANAMSGDIHAQNVILLIDNAIKSTLVQL